MRIIALLLVILLAGFSGAVPGSGQEGVRPDQDGFRVTVVVDLVTLEVGVTDASGRPVTTLSRDEFEIYEDGNRQELQSFAAVSTPYNVLLLFDCSGSTEPSWQFLFEAMKRFTGQLRNQDGIAVAQFGSGFKKLLDWSAITPKGLSVTVQVGDRTCGGTDFYRAVSLALSEVRRTNGRKGVIVLTDGQHQDIPMQPITSRTALKSRYVDPSEDRDFQNVLKSARAGGTVLYFIAVDTDLNPGPPGAASEYDPLDIYNMQQARVRLELLAEASGGRVAYPRVPSDVVPLFEQIGRELGTSYGLAYSSSNGKGAHKIEVRVRDRNLKVRQSRETYEVR